MAASFDEISQEWLIKFLEHRIGDRRIIRLIQKWLKAGVLEDGVVTPGEKGTGQGSVISPLLANIYLHYGLDLWVDRYRRREATGDMIIVRYADDFIVGFQHETDARRFLDAMRSRLEGFALTLHPEKTRLIEFGRYAAQNRKRRGLGKPETFNFLGFTFICGKSRRGGFLIKRRTRGDRMKAKLQAIKGAVAAHALADPQPGEMAGSCRQRLLQLPRGADQLSCTCAVPRRDHSPLETGAQSPKPEGGCRLDSDDGDSRRIPPTAGYPPSLARAATRRPSPEVRAVCGKAARPDLCGGCEVTRIPTATQRRPSPGRSQMPAPASSMRRCW